MTSESVLPNQNLKFDLTPAELAQIEAYAGVDYDTKNSVLLANAECDGTERIYVIGFDDKNGFVPEGRVSTKMGALLRQAQLKRFGYKMEIRLLTEELTKQREIDRRRSHSSPEHSFLHSVGCVVGDGLSFTLNEAELELLRKYETTWVTADNLQFYRQAANDGSPAVYVLVETFGSKDMIDGSKEPRTKMAAVLEQAKRAGTRTGVRIFHIDVVREQYEIARTNYEQFILARDY